MKLRKNKEKIIRWNKSVLLRSEFKVGIDIVYVPWTEKDHGLRFIMFARR